ncbi:MAG: alpha-hydroxy acid oxidase [bacterium]
MSVSEVPSFENLRQLKTMARDQVSNAAFDYVAGGAGDERTLESNRRAYENWELIHRVLRDVSDCDASTEVLGTEVEFPALVAPTAFHCLMHEDGETATVQGAHQAGTLFTASTLATKSLEDIAEASEGPRWYQLYIYRDRSLTKSLVQRAEEAGYSALVLTVDSPVWGRRERDIRNGFSLPDDLGLANFRELEQEDLPDAESGENGLAEYVSQQLDPSLTWDDVQWLNELTELPLLIKGVVDPGDAREALRHGCAGVVVSNHGGRQLDAGIPTLEALPDVVEAVGDEGEVYLDGGIRRGTDVLIALALGARAVLVGRPVLWSLAVGGTSGVDRALTLLKDEIENGLALCGLRSVDDISADRVRRTRQQQG